MISRHGEIGRHAALRRQCLRHLGSNPSGGIFSLLILYYRKGNHSFFLRVLMERDGRASVLRPCFAKLYYLIFSVVSVVSVVIEH